ncbi:L,D-transpeptidase [Acuticoccus sp. M5D2P5]|uniref:L,D-transpeptidase n=1 Tax=Acuticoccus kalidii TaxID=2910977 RepID=UPI001F26575A|nr:L,D-transpeptidase [Acuticoccus kalidii]MCF3933801.1 L,D-transpeptidase [Acuticoccus kalidii]
MRAKSILSPVLGFIAMVALAAPTMAAGLQLTDPRTGEAFTYRPSFAPRERQGPERPQYRFFDTSKKEWVTYQASREEMRERHRMKFARAYVGFNTSEPAGTIIVDTAGRYLYHVNRDGTAVRYGIGVGREGFTWSGVERITRKAEWPDWRPPAEMRARQPGLPEWMPGGPENPLGARALYLGSTLYRIHGTHEDETIGYAVSSGCIRMLNEDVVDLYSRVKVGTEVVVLGPGSDRSGLMAALNPL